MACAQTGELSRLKMLCGSERHRAVSELTKVHGVGAVTAEDSAQNRPTKNTSAGASSRGGNGFHSGLV